ncbi:MAG: hypothetical protein U9N57_03240, partial [Pseudomonadota bacterium]|nr:hypothetical protein [Pseudomonadota bacterium]
MKHLFIASTLLLSTTLLLTGCISHAPVKSVHVVKVHPSHHNSNHVKKHNYTSHSTVNVYQTHYPKVIRYEAQRFSHYVYEESLHKKHHSYVKTHKSIKPHSRDNNKNHAHSKKKVIKNKRTVKMVKKSRPINVHKPKKPLQQSRSSDNKNPKKHKSNRKEN